MADKGLRSIEITIYNKSEGTLYVSAASLRGTAPAWIEGQEPPIDDGIPINGSKKYGSLTKRNLEVGFEVSFEGIGALRLDALVTTRNKPTVEQDADTGITVTGTEGPTNSDDQHPEYRVTIAGNATRKVRGIYGPELAKL